MADFNFVNKTRVLGSATSHGRASACDLGGGWLGGLMDRRADRDGPRIQQLPPLGRGKFVCELSDLQTDGATAYLFEEFVRVLCDGEARPLVGINNASGQSL
jgi:hypothetical protein